MNLSNIKDEKFKKKIPTLKNVQSKIKKEEFKKLLKREKCKTNTITTNKP